jgi:hypothetical protein
MTKKQSGPQEANAKSEQWLEVCLHAGHNCVHPGGDPVGRERPQDYSWPGLFELPEVGSHAYSPILGRAAYEPVGVFRCFESVTTREATSRLSQPVPSTLFQPTETAEPFERRKR